MFTTCYVKNISGSPLNLRHQFDVDEEYQIKDNELDELQAMIEAL